MKVRIFFLFFLILTELFYMQMDGAPVLAPFPKTLLQIILEWFLTLRAILELI